MQYSLLIAFPHWTTSHPVRTVWKTTFEALYLEKSGLRANEVWQWWRETDNRWEALSKNMTCLRSWVRKQHNDTIYLLPPLTGNCCSVYLCILGGLKRFELLNNVLFYLVVTAEFLVVLQIESLHESNQYNWSYLRCPVNHFKKYCIMVLHVGWGEWAGN